MIPLKVGNVYANGPFDVRRVAEIKAQQVYLERRCRVTGQVSGRWHNRRLFEQWLELAVPQEKLR